MHIRVRAFGLPPARRAGQTLPDQRPQLALPANGRPSRFTSAAKHNAERVPARLALIDGHMLATLMVNRNIDVQDRETCVIKRIDEDFFEDSGQDPSGNCGP